MGWTKTTRVCHDYLPSFGHLDRWLPPLQENSRRRKLTSTYGNGATNGGRCTCDSTNFALLTTSKPVGTPSLAFHPTQLTAEGEWLLKFYLDSDPAVAAAPADSVGENSRGIDPNHRVGHKLYKELYRQTVII